MLIHLHSQATTTPKIRAAIQVSDEPAWVLAERFGTTEQTVWKWRERDSVHDRSHTAHRLQTTLTPAQEAVAVALRKTLLVSLDDLLAVVREFLKPPLPIRRRTRDHAAPLCLALQPTAPPISLGQQDALASDEGLAQTHTRTVQQTAILPSGM
jgi:transposase-like protein